MITISLVRKFAATLAAAALFCSATAEACTGIRLTAADGSVVHARTLEFGIDLDFRYPYDSA